MNWDWAFVEDMDRILCKFLSGTKLCGAISKLKRRDAIQRTLTGQKWVCANLMKFNKAKC